MKVLPYLLLLAVISGLQACIFRPSRPTTTTATTTTTTTTPTCVCGKVGPGRVRNGTRVIAGGNADRFEYPWIVRVLRKYLENGIERWEACGGSLLSPSTVLTAAHCINEDDNRSNYLIYVGEYDISTWDQGEDEIHHVQRLEPHPDYYSNDHISEFDYGIITLEDPVTFTDKIYSICLNEDPNRDLNRDTVIIGWGRTDPDPNVSSQPNILQEVTLTSASSATECSTLIANHATPGFEDRLICMKGTTNESNCGGDSGGPAMVAISPEQYVLTGVISGAFACRNGLAARVTNQLTWIRDRIVGQECATPANLNELK